jgi:hypothetical protein
MSLIQHYFSLNNIEVMTALKFKTNKLDHYITTKHTNTYKHTPFSLPWLSLHYINLVCLFHCLLVRELHCFSSGITFRGFSFLSHLENSKVVCSSGPFSIFLDSRQTHVLRLLPCTLNSYCA